MGKKDSYVFFFLSSAARSFDQKIHKNTNTKLRRDKNQIYFLRLRFVFPNFFKFLIDLIFFSLSLKSFVEMYYAGFFVFFLLRFIFPSLSISRRFFYLIFDNTRSGFLVRGREAKTKKFKFRSCRFLSRSQKSI